MVMEPKAFDGNANYCAVFGFINDGLYQTSNIKNLKFPYAFAHVYDSTTKKYVEIRNSKQLIQFHITPSQNLGPSKVVLKND